MKIMTFVEGTLTKPTKKLEDLSTYIPTEGSVEKLNLWKKKAEIVYMISGREKDVEKTKELLKKLGFPDGRILFRRLDYQRVDDYLDIIKEENPDVYIDDTVESDNMFEVVEPRFEKDCKIKLITVAEFGGFNHLPDNPKELLSAQSVVETYEIPQGRMFIVKSDKSMSAGFLELNTGSEIKEEARAVSEFLKQVKGASLVKLEDKEELLSPLEEFEIPAGKSYTHSNSVGEISLTFWVLKGDVTGMIDKIRKTFKRI